MENIQWVIEVGKYAPVYECHTNREEMLSLEALCFFRAVARRKLSEKEAESVLRRAGGNYTVARGMLEEQQQKEEEKGQSRPQARVQDVGMRLRLAALRGDATELKAMLSTEEGRQAVNEGDGSGVTALHFSVTQNRIQCAVELIRHGANVNVTDHNGHTPLFGIAVGGCADLLLIDLLIKNGAAIDHLDRTGKTALTHALMSRNTMVPGHARNLCKALIARGARVERNALPAEAFPFQRFPPWALEAGSKRQCTIALVTLIGIRTFRRQNVALFKLVPRDVWVGIICKGMIWPTRVDADRWLGVSTVTTVVVNE